jgi:alkanesulfonate monooxygenase SsuD/methylene tetrahydromethanopterin reductase-like flavin-dependent oxidoreductase (luciferase family)
MKVGLYLDLRNPPQWRRPWSAVYGDALALCERVDAGGADSLWLSEHHLFEDGYLPQPLSFAAAVAARTTRVRIGTAVLIAPLRHAAHILEEAHVVDLISEGRLDLGLGAGNRVPEFELFGLEYGKPLPLLFERVREMRAIAKDITPPSHQDPLPLWLGCNGPWGARRAGLVGERLLSVRPDLAAHYIEGLEAGGHSRDQARMSGPVNLFLSDDPERDWPVVREYYAYIWDTYARGLAEGRGRPAPPPVDPDEWRARGLAAGLRGMVIATPADAARMLREYLAEAPVETVFMWAWLPGIPAELVDRHVHLVGTELRDLLQAT